MFANNYITKNNLSPRLSSKVDEKLKIIVVIPCFNEPDILSTLESLNNCQNIALPIEVIIVINHSENESNIIKKQNQKTKDEIKNWCKQQQPSIIKIHTIGPVDLRKKWAGVGLARKIGMDEAVLRFNQINQPNGIIVSLDADTLVDPNYFSAILHYFNQHPKNVGATINFLHKKKGLPQKIKQGIELYEQYMDYYKQSISYTGYPYAMFTVGSAFAVTASAYVKRGGMNRRQAGEDFYFLQNLAHIGTVGTIDTTTVYPAARISNRVPFGTGPILQKWIDGTEDLTKTYNFEAFMALKELFDCIDSLYKINHHQYEKLILNLPTSIQLFLKETGFYTEIDNLNQNCSSLKVFKKQFYHRFNAFQILKFLNYAHEKHYEKADLKEQIEKLYQLTKVDREKNS